MSKALSQLAWEWIKEQPEFTSKTLAAHMDVSLYVAQMLIATLQEKKAVITTHGSLHPAIYAAAPGAKPEWKGKARFIYRPKSARQKIWQAMRFLHRFTCSDVVATSETTKASVEKFLSDLVKAGYVKIVNPQKRKASMAERRQHQVQYLLIKNTGYKYPVVRKAEVLDQNLGSTMPLNSKGGLHDVA